MEGKAHLRSDNNVPLVVREQAPNDRNHLPAPGDRQRATRRKEVVLHVDDDERSLGHMGERERGGVQSKGARGLPGEVISRPFIADGLSSLPGQRDQSGIAGCNSHTTITNFLTIPRPAHYNCMTTAFTRFSLRNDW